MDYNIVRIWKIDWNRRRTLTPDEQQDKIALGEEFWPPWMETGLIRTCFSCGYEVWESVDLRDACSRCGMVTGVEHRQPNWLERLVHWYRADNKFSPVQAAKGVKSKKTIAKHTGKPERVDLPPMDPEMLRSIEAAWNNEDEDIPSKQE